MSKVYVYKEYCDGYAYGEEAVEVYADREKARAALLESMANMYDYNAPGFGPLNITNMIKALKAEDLLSDEDTVSEDYVSIEGGDGVHFWIIEEKDVL